MSCSLLLYRFLVHFAFSDGVLRICRGQCGTPDARWGNGGVLGRIAGTLNRWLMLCLFLHKLDKVMKKNAIGKCTTPLKQVLNQSWQELVSKYLVPEEEELLGAFLGPSPLPIPKAGRKELVVRLLMATRRPADKAWNLKIAMYHKSTQTASREHQSTYREVCHISSRPPIRVCLLGWLQLNRKVRAKAVT